MATAQTEGNVVSDSTPAQNSGAAFQTGSPTEPQHCCQEQPCFAIVHKAKAEGFVCLFVFLFKELEQHS